MRAAWDEPTVQRMLEARDPNALLREHSGLLGAVLDRIEEDMNAYSTHYGSWMGGDPRRFAPDPECSTPEEREAHRLACEAAERGDPGSRNLNSPFPGALHQDQRFGLGTTTFVDEGGENLVTQLRALLGRPIRLSPAPSLTSPAEQEHFER